MTFWNIFRLTLVTFFLYLLGDAFYRWDGFSYYASFLEFLPSIALISVLWFIITALSAICIWLLLNICNWMCRLINLRVNGFQLLLNAGLLILIGAGVYGGKKILWTNLQTTLYEKMIVFVSVIMLSIFLTWLLRHKAEALIGNVNERITPLVCLFGFITVLSVPVVFIYAVWKIPVKTDSGESSQVFTTDRNRPNIILVTYDAMTSENMSLYGYHKETTPFISAWAESAAVFSKCEAASNTTSQTTASLMTGKRVWSHKRYQSDAGAASRIYIENMPLLLRNSGYFNMAFIANEIASVEKQGISINFHVKPSSYEMIDPASIYGFLSKYLVKYFSSKIQLYDWLLKEDFILGVFINVDFVRHPHRTEYPAKKVFDMFFNELNNSFKEPFFAWIHLNPPHAPYLPPDPYMGMFDSSPKYRTAKSQYPLINPRYYAPEQQPDADIIRGRYDEFIRYCDDQFKYFIEQLEKRDMVSNTVIILSSDHGESFDHGYFTHGSHFLYEDMTRIPLIIKDPAQKEGRTIDFPVEQIDITATILDLAHIPVPDWMEGRSLLPLLRGEELQPQPVFSMCLETSHVHGKISDGIFAVWEGDYKLIYYITTKESLLFNLKIDPDERNNIFSIEPERGRYLLGLIQDKLEKINKEPLVNEYPVK